MSASWGRRARRAGLFPVFLILPLLAVSALAQDSPPEGSGEQFPLGATARTNLTQLQMDWLDWLVACNEGDGDRVAVALESLQSHTRLVGMDGCEHHA